MPALYFRCDVHVKCLEWLKLLEWWKAGICISVIVNWTWLSNATIILVVSRGDPGKTNLSSQVVRLYCWWNEVPVNNLAEKRRWVVSVGERCVLKLAVQVLKEIQVALKLNHGAGGEIVVSNVSLTWLGGVCEWMQGDSSQCWNKCWLHLLYFIPLLKYSW